MKTRPLGPTPLRIGVLGCAGIARVFTRDVAASSKVAVVAVASRQAETAAAFARDCGIARWHGSYDALLADRGVDAIYLPLPNSLHAEWAVKAAQSGKHVLCEKPLALTRAEAQAMFDAAARHRVVLLESFPYYFQPQTGVMLSLLHEGSLGPVRSVQASFGVTLGNPQTNIRMRPELGGGALLDAGSYPLSLIRLVMGTAPERVIAHATWAESGVDLSTMATLVYSGQRRAQLSCAMDTAAHRRATIACANGTIETEYPNHTADAGEVHPFGYLPTRLRVRRGTHFLTPFEDVVTGSGSGFRFAAEAFAKVVADADFAAVSRAAQASLDNAATLKAIADSARSAQAVTLG